MIGKVGLLHRGLESLVDGAWSIYSAWEYAYQPSQPDYTTALIDEFKKTFSRSSSPPVEFLGLFDCVNSVGLVIDRSFPFSSKLDLVKQIRHAVSIDERRGKYKQNMIFPNPYNYSWIPKSSTGTPSTFISRKTSTGVSTSDISSKLYETRKLMKDIEARLVAIGRSRNHVSVGSSLSRTSSHVDKTKILSGEFQELWFPGNHGDVGGGWNPDKNGQFLSNIPLRWMLGESIEFGVLFDKERVVEFAERYSSLDSFLSCGHDVLNLTSYGLTHSISSLQQSNILKLSDRLSGKRPSPYFRSCDIPKTKSLEALFNNGVYSISLKKLNFDLGDPFERLKISEIFSYYKSLPTEKIQAFDGSGDTGVVVALIWWLIEFLPLGTKVENFNNEWQTVYKPNLGRLRVIPSYSKLHWSVYWRMKYCYDYNPTNLPEYVQLILNNISDYSFGEPEDDINIDNILLRRVVKETTQNIALWEKEKWQIVPDDLIDILEKFNYLTDEQPSSIELSTALASNLPDND